MLHIPVHDPFQVGDQVFGGIKAGIAFQIEIDLVVVKILGNIGGRLRINGLMEDLFALYLDKASGGSDYAVKSYFGDKIVDLGFAPSGTEIDLVAVLPGLLYGLDGRLGNKLRVGGSVD